MSQKCIYDWMHSIIIRQYHRGRVSGKVPSSMRKITTLSCTCAKSHPDICSQMKHSIVSNDSVCGTAKALIRLRWCTGWSGPSLSPYARSPWRSPCVTSVTYLIINNCGQFRENDHSCICGQRRHMSVCAGAQADLGLRCPLTKSLDIVEYKY